MSFRWTDAEIRRARQMRKERLSDKEIDRRLDRPPGSTAIKFATLDESPERRAERLGNMRRWWRQNRGVEARESST